MRRCFGAAIAAALLAASPILADGFTPPETPRQKQFDVETPAGSRLEFRGAVAISPPTADFGGLSGLFYKRFVAR